MDLTPEWLEMLGAAMPVQAWKLQEAMPVQAWKRQPASTSWKDQDQDQDQLRYSYMFAAATDSLHRKPPRRTDLAAAATDEDVDLTSSRASMLGVGFLKSAVGLRRHRALRSYRNAGSAWRCSSGSVAGARDHLLELFAVVQDGEFVIEMSTLLINGFSS
ncbi:uncharacterized protein LOC8081322 isoform X3 [Sorghum bicolor]|uniref:uncharacterized protein LOC8081322 isoform X3 n=1 Tax=Sorghum bicolor TaxID=4558 RepID=UPI000B42486A|nr:uncharacterized protein LOC8081322 isoform X3 [Sorghum bicolor]|eukprot:XP_021312327.1 uncharacterized protein LOC8081322 isoform X3 [Sorghum bicolor]